MRVIWLARARFERERAIDYIGSENPRAALRQLAEIERRTDLLAEYPEIGRSGRLRGTRELVITGTPFLAIYRIRQRTKIVEIVRVLHGAQQWPPKKT